MTVVARQIISVDPLKLLLEFECSCRRLESLNPETAKKFFAPKAHRHRLSNLLLTNTLLLMTQCFSSIVIYMTPFGLHHFFAAAAEW